MQSPEPVSLRQAPVNCGKEGAEHANTHIQSYGDTLQEARLFVGHTSDSLGQWRLCGRVRAKTVDTCVQDLRLPQQR